METERSSLVARGLETPKKDLQLRVTPSEVKFLDALAGKVYRLPVTVHNLGRCNQKIRFQDPVKPQFKLLLTNLDKALASGLQTTAIVEYHPDKDEDTFDQLLISVGNKTLEIPLIGLIPSCQLEIESEVNFGILVANNKVHCKEINIVNHGTVPGMFKTEYQGQLPIVFFPNNGIVQPKSSMVIKVDFCADQPIIVNEVAKLIIDGQVNNDPSHRQDYAVFLRFESVGSKDGFLRDDNSKTIKSDRFQKVELALTGSGLPVLLQFDPGRVLNFAPCFIGGRSEIQCVMQNRSKSLPVMYHFKKTAHFKIDPQRGKIDEGSMQVSNPTGQFVVENLVEYKDHAPVAMLQSTATQIHNHSTNKELIKDAMIAFPNDRAASIRSGDEHKHFRTIFTKIPRYTYVDPDFAYTEFEKIDKKAHENSYTRYIKYLRNVRLQKQAQRFSKDLNQSHLQPMKNMTVA
ncbi:Cilia- and flagella-associated protein 47 [Camelus dromedarius]|uniref:Cilia-and flagella-associated protein 47 n=1 Tax=Camelus dromedarius TaxID=9838 RepID=A0A5N4C3G9_CAMDR|nr:Cilia- and flagella-associated protein 47 [Camelus dromedarius]